MALAAENDRGENCAPTCAPTEAEQDHRATSSRKANIRPTGTTAAEFFRKASGIVHSGDKDSQGFLFRQYLAARGVRLSSSAGIILSVQAELLSEKPCWWGAAAFFCLLLSASFLVAWERVWRRLGRILSACLLLVLLSYVSVDCVLPGGLREQRKLAGVTESRTTTVRPVRSDQWIFGKVLFLRFPEPHAMRVSLKVINSGELKGKVMLDLPYLPWLTSSELEKGALLRLKAKITLLRRSGASAPDLFSYQGYLYRRGYSATGFLLDNESLEIVSSRQGKSICLRLVEVLTPDYPLSDAWSVICAVVLGHRDHPGELLWQLFRDTGLSHFLVISGFHVGFVFMVIFKALSFLLSRFKALLLLSIVEPLSLLGGAVAAAAYTEMSGGEIPAVRAAFVVLLTTCGRLLYRRQHPINSLLLAFVFVLLVWPAAGFEAGTQLTFSALLGLLAARSCFPEARKDREPEQEKSSPRFILWIRIKDYAQKSLVYSYFAWLFTLPVQLVWFSAFVPFSTFFNAIFTQVFCFLLVLMAGFSLVLYWLGVPGAQCLLTLSVRSGDAAIYALRAARDFTENLGCSTVELHEEPVYFLTACVGLGVLAITFILQREVLRSH
jgi:ComEC/Rec2-related protein